MNLKYLIENVDKSESNIDDCSEENIFSTLGLDYYQLHNKPTKLVCYWLSIWLCTDTHVGHRVYFLNDEFVVYSTQNSRKDEEIFYWKDTTSKKKVYNYLSSCIVEIDDDSYHLFLSNKDFKSDYNIGYQVTYGSQILDKNNAIYKNDEELHIVNIIKIFDISYYSSDMWTKVEIEFKDNSSTILPLKNIYFPYKLKENY